MKRARLAATLAALVVAACTDSLAVPDSPTGSLSIGVEGDCRGSSCGDPHPVTVLARLRVVATGTRAQSSLRAESNAPTVAAVLNQAVTCGDTTCDYVVEVETRTAGIADITFSNPDGTLVDLIRFQVLR